MSHLVFALVNGVWMPQVLEKNKLKAPAPQFLYSPTYSLTDGTRNIYYFHESYIEGELMFSRVLFVNTQGALNFMDGNQYYTVGEVVSYHPSLNPPKIEPVHFNAMLAYTLAQWIIDLWVVNCNVSYAYMLDDWQWNAINEAIMLRQQNLAYEASINQALAAAAEAQQALSDVQYKIESLESQLQKQQAAKPKAKPVKKPQAKKPSQEELRKNSVSYAIAKFTVLNNVAPAAYDQIYQLFNELLIKPEEQPAFVAKLTISIEQCHKFLHAFSKHIASNSVKVCFLKKLATYTAEEHEAYILANKNAHAIIETARAIKPDSDLLLAIIDTYTKIQSKIDKEYDQLYAKPLRLLQKAIETLDYDEYQQLIAEQPALLEKASQLFSQALKFYDKSKYDAFIKAKQKGLENPDFYATLEKFIQTFNVTAETCLQILKDPAYRNEVKLVLLHRLELLTPEQYYLANQESDFEALYHTYCSGLDHNDQALHNKLKQCQISSEQWFEQKAQEVVALLTSTEQSKLDAHLLAKFAKRTNAEKQTVLMLAIKHNYKPEVIKAIANAAGATLFQTDSQGQNILHYLAKYYKSYDWDILEGLDLTNELFLAQAIKTGDTYLHYLIRFQKRAYIVKFLDKLKDPTLAITSKNKQGETVATLLDDKELEWEDVRDYLYQQIEGKYKTISPSIIFDCGFFTANTKGNRLFELAGTNPARLIDILNARTKLINNITGKHSKELDDINKHTKQGQNLHWHLTKALLDPKYQSLAATYSNSFFHNNCSPLKMIDSLAFKKMLATNFSNVTTIPRLEKDATTATQSAMRDVVKFLLHHDAVSEFIDLVVKHKLVVQLAYVLLMTIRTTPQTDLVLEMDKTLRAPEKVFILEQLLRFLPPEYNKVFAQLLTSYYLDHKEYKLLTKLIAENKYATNEIIGCINRDFASTGKYAGQIPEFINDIRSQSLTSLMLFLINYISKTEPDNHFNIIMLYLAEATKNEDNYSLLRAYMKVINIDRLSIFVTTIVSYAAYKNNIFLLEKLYPEAGLVLPKKILISIAVVCDSTQPGLEYLFNQSIKRIPLEKNEDQATILIEIYLGLIAAAKPDHAKLWVQLVEDNMRNDLEIIPTAFEALKQKSEDINVTVTTLQRARSQNHRNKIS